MRGRRKETGGGNVEGWVVPKSNLRLRLGCGTGSDARDR